MIKSLSLTNWKSFGSAQLWVDPLTFIIGTNSAGKSNIVDALSFLRHISSANRISDANIRGGIDGLISRNQNCSSLHLQLILDNEEYSYEFSFVMEGKELLVNKEILAVKSAKGEKRSLFYTEECEAGAMQITVCFEKDRKGSYKTMSLKREVSILSQIPNLNILRDIKEKAENVLNSIKSIFILDPKPERMRDYTPLADSLASDGSNIAGVIAALPDESKREFEETLTDYVRPLPEKDLNKIWAEPIGLFKTDAMLYCTEEWVDGESTTFDARSMSDGTLRFIAIVSALLTAKKGSTIVIEEVDNGLHPSRAAELVSALKNLGEKKKIDILCTTHNPVLIDALGPNMLPFISYVTRSEENGSSEIHLLEDAPQLLKLLANYSPGDMMTKGILTSEAK